MEKFLVRVIVADDHPVTGHGIAHGLSRMPTIDVVAMVADAKALVEQLDTTPCDVLVLDYVMPAAAAGQYGDGQALVAFLGRRYPQLRIVTVTMLSSPPVFRALQLLGVHCIASKSDSISHMVAAVHAAYANGSYLSPAIA
ncbi:response regulator [Burkholderia contaminans]|uniref:response regulator n=1 Tax=Burkholderia contaminans TaxID=488447 RepID=UPI0014545BD5|nr:response regulator transcription factor [Burkholderia contaminans]MCA8157743.1 response regulator transcription factor [Burkholderia contaminans]VWD55071.1 LuxR family transcriptional regulator [Burkholderia contaminans]